MGAWGSGSFENDDAMDWTSDLSASLDWSAVRDALDDVLGYGPDDYLGAPEAAVALAAAEVVAAALGAPAGDLPEEVTTWVATHRRNAMPEHAQDALRAVERVMADSELLELWDESDEASEWQANVADLRRRLTGPTGP